MEKQVVQFCGYKFENRGGLLLEATAEGWHGRVAGCVTGCPGVYVIAARRQSGKHDWGGKQSWATRGRQALVQVHDWLVIDVGISDDVPSRIKNHDREDCWVRCEAEQIFYREEASETTRRAIETEIREDREPPCGER